MQIPLFPLNVVLFPEGELKLRIFEPRYIHMVSDCLRNDTGVGVCFIPEDKDMSKSADFFSEMSKFQKKLLAKIL